MKNEKLIIKDEELKKTNIQIQNELNFFKNKLLYFDEE